MCDIKVEDQSVRTEMKPETEITENRKQPHEKKPNKWRTLWPQLLVSITMSFGSIIVGFATSYSAPALASMSSETSTLHPTQEEKSWIGSLMPLFALFGGFMGGSLMTSLGRRFAMLSIGFPCSISFLLITMAQNMVMIMVGRSLMGLCIGIATLVFPIYLGETIEPKYRGVLGLFPTIFGNSGVLISYTVGMFLNWSYLALFGAFLPIPFVLCGLAIPETPRWHINKGQTKNALAALQWLRGREDVTEEFNEIESSYKDNQNSHVSYKQLIKSGYAKPILICLALMFFQQLSGINAIIFYSVDIFKESGNNMDSNIQSIALAAVNILSTAAATILIDRLGRKLLLYISSITMIITLGLIGAYFKLRKMEESSMIEDKPYLVETANYGWIPLACLIVYIIGFSMGFGPVTWLMMGELLPGRIKGLGASLSTAFNWACSFLVTKTFASMMETLGLDGTFWLYGGFCLLAVFFVAFIVPETKGKSLEDIEKLFIKTTISENENPKNICANKMDHKPEI